MKDLTTDRQKPVKAEGRDKQFVPPPDPPAARQTRRIVLTIGRQRYELTSYTEIREITRGSAKLIQMPGRPTIDRDQPDRLR